MIVYSVDRDLIAPISAEIRQVRPWLFQFISFTKELEQVTPTMEQHALMFVGSIEVVFPISCQTRTTQQHCGDDELHFVGSFKDPDIRVLSKFLSLVHGNRTE
jgi:hypothetical protein